MFKATPHRTRESTGEQQEPAGDASAEGASETAAKPRRRRIQKKRTDGGVSEEAEATGGEGKKRTSRKGPPEDGIPSTTTIYVANIPFTYTDDKVRKSLFAICL